MKKLSVMIVAVMCLTLGLSACGNSGGTQNTGSTGSSELSAPDGKVYNFSVSHQDPATGPAQQSLEEWGNAVTEASGGRITFTYYPGETLAAGADQVEAVLNRTADICWTSVNQNAGRFPQFEAMSLPMLDIENALMASRICWELYERNDFIREDWKDFKVISLNTDLPNTICVAGSTPEKFADFKGLQLRVSGALLSSFASAVGIAPVSMKMPEVYESVEKGVINGMIVPFSTLKTYSFYDIVESIVDYPISYGPQFVIMNKDSYNTLPDDLKEIFDRYCGAYCSELFAKRYTTGADEAMKVTVDAGVTIVKPSDELISDWVKATAGVEADWIKAADASGYDGQLVVKTIKSLADEFRTEYTK